MYFYTPENFDFHKKPTIEQKNNPEFTPYNMGMWCINPILHHMQPTFKLYKQNTEEYKNIISKLDNKSMLAKMCYDDRIAKYYNAKPNDLFKIIRQDQTLSYRLVSPKAINLIKKPTKK